MRLRMVLLTGLLLGTALSGVSSHADEPVESDPHAHHRHMMEAPAPVRRSEMAYQVPAVRLVRDDGKAVALQDELAGDRPVVLAFIYTSCTTVCPLRESDLGATPVAPRLLT
jgi:protein SCO1/2